MIHDELSYLQGHVHPGHPSRGTPARTWLAEVITINPDGTVDARPVNSRATKIGVQIPGGYAPTLGDMVLITDVGGDPRQPIVVQPITRTIPTVTGAKTGNTPLVLSLLAALRDLNLIDDQTT